jgi:hypothetical protein
MQACWMFRSDEGLPKAYSLHFDTETEDKSIKSLLLNDLLVELHLFAFPIPCRFCSRDLMNGFAAIVL